MKKVLKLTGVATGIALLALVGIYLQLPAKQTKAQSMSIPAAPTTSTLTVSNTNNSATMNLASIGPYSQDFRYELCWNGNQGGQACTWSQWAADMAHSDDHGVYLNYFRAPQFSNWIWPGYANGMSAGDLSIAAIQTRPLPAGEEITNVRVGIELSEDNRGTLVGTDNDISCFPSLTPYTSPAQSSPAYAYFEGNCESGSPSPSSAPDVLRIYLDAGIVAPPTITSNIPSVMTVGQTIASATITVVNNNIGWVANGLDYSGYVNSVEPIGPNNNLSSQYCAVGTDGINYPYNTPSYNGNNPGIEYDCYTNMSITLEDLTLTHTSSGFQTATVVPYQHNDFEDNYITPEYTEPCDPSSDDYYYGELCDVPSTSGEYLTGPELFPGGDNDAYGGDYLLGIFADSSGVFNIGSFTAPTNPGTYTETWTLSDAPGYFSYFQWLASSATSTIPGGVYTQTIQVVGTSTTPCTGSGCTSTTTLPTSLLSTINVFSENSTNGNPVDASWGLYEQDIPGFDVCSWANIACSGSNQSYLNVPVGTSNIQAISSLDPNYALKGVEETTIAKANTNPIEHLFAVSKNFLVGIANAYSYCSYLGSGSGTSCSSANNVDSLTTFNNGDTANYTILWDPKASMSISPSNVSLDSASNPSQTITISNNGAPGSELGWTQSITPSSATSWLSVSPASDSNGVGGGSSESVTLAANTGSLATGTYMATVTFTGSSLNVSSSPVLPQSVNVSFTVEPSGCTGSGCGATTTIPTSTNPCSGSGCGSAPCSGSGCTSTTTPPTSPTNTPSCSFTANPSSVVVPGSSQLFQNCTDVNTCILSGGKFGSGTSVAVSGTELDAPTVNTIYQLNCSGADGPTNSSLQVTVTNPGRTETNP